MKKTMSYVRVCVGLLLLTSLVTLTACASATVTAMDGGQQTADIDCSGKNKTIDACYKKAQIVCPDGYQIIDNKALPPTDGSLTDALVVGMARQIPSVQATVRGIVVECKGKMAQGKAFWMIETGT